MMLGTYEIEREIGRGGMGVVFRGRAPDGTAVAVKQLLQARRPEAVARFERERRLLSELGAKDGFVPLLDCGTSAHGPYIVMPFLGGGSLRERLMRGPLPVEEALELARSLARALSRAHARKIVHRDLKPDNVLFTDDGKPLVADLGLAKHFSRDNPEAQGSISISIDGEIVGSVGYMAPEQMNNAKAVGPPTDVFALGAILHECLTGAMAFEGDTAHAVLAKVAIGDHPPARKLRPETPRWVDQVIAKALATKPEERYPDAGALLAGLQGGRGGVPRSAAIAIGAVVVLGLAAGALALALGGGEPPPSATNTALPSSRTGQGAKPTERASPEPRIALRVSLPDIQVVSLAVDPETERALITAGSQSIETPVLDGRTGKILTALPMTGCCVDSRHHLILGVTVKGAEAVAYDVGTFAEQWRKPTRFWGVNTDVDPEKELLYVACQAGAPNDPVLVLNELTGEPAHDPIRRQGVCGHVYADARTHRAFANWGDGPRTAMVSIGPPPAFEILGEQADMGIAGVDEAHHRVLCSSNSAPSHIIIIDEQTNEVIHTQAVVRGTLVCAPDARKNGIYLAQPLPEGLQFLEGDRLERAKPIHLDPGFTPEALAVDPKNRKLYVAASGYKERKLFIFLLP